ncbi:GNAT family N-acetyltransferase [Microbulbifer sp. YPW1]|uniref:GNAT family N-acetyltransferase n=1 Tax=Microbulbifer sp. YPW1 TaxID=2745199 RepID=UPI00159A0DD5|nr:GNAT family N-acetyltransferase [Microbulbifer sp. YPW1]QKX17168.1 GNAT family N-acetyltransferase [Microbulbifer sp. YPW1]
MQIINLAHAPEVIGTLARWHFDEWHTLYPEETLEDFQTELVASTAQGTVPSTFVAQVDGNVVGSISLLPHDMDIDEPWTPWLANLYVHPDYRQQGAGKQLVQHLIAFARRNSLDQLYLFTPSSRDYYEALGWTLLRRQSYKGQQVDIMLLALSETGE